MWSSNKNINILVNLLIFLMSINFMHYGQLCIPLICLILFVDNKFKFKVNNKIVFALLVVFGLSVFAFTFKFAGSFSTVGLFVPMAYYIGSNIKNYSLNSIKNVMYITTLGMICHVFLNMAYDISIYGLDFVYHQSCWDFWYREKVNPTGVAVNMTFLISVIYYVLVHEKKIAYKLIGFIVLVLTVYYDIGLGRRTPLLMLVLDLVVCVVLDCFVFRNIKINKKIFAIIAISLLLLFSVFMISGGLLLVKDTTIWAKFRDYGFDPQRVQLLTESFKLMPSHLWGGREIHELIGNPIHDLWFDIYDFAGIIPFVLIVIYTIHVVFALFRLLKNKKVSNTGNLLILSFSMCCFIQCVLEPALTGSSIFFLSFVLVYAVIETVTDVKSS